MTVVGIVAIVTVAFMPTLAAAAAALPHACRVRNVTQNTRFATDTGAALAAAVGGADPGDRLRVLGTCVGLYVLDNDLILVGSRAGAPRTVLDGGGQGRVLGSTSASARCSSGSPSLAGCPRLWAEGAASTSMREPASSSTTRS
jgi:hypothetical protein